MTLGITAQVEDIATLMKTNLVPTVYDTEIPPATTVAYTNGIMDPYYVVTFGGPVRASQGRGIVSTRNDVTMLYCTVSCVAPDITGRNYLVDAAIDLLTGYKPVDSGEMVLDGGLQYSNAYADVRPVKYYKDLSFIFRSNLTSNL